MTKDSICGMMADEKTAMSDCPGTHAGRKLGDDPQMHDHDQEHGSESATHSRNHLLMMVLCCLVPIAILIAVVYTGIGSDYLPFLLAFLCPLLMLLMYLPSMLPRKRKDQENHQHTDAASAIEGTLLEMNWER